jgi:hypothetical protein
MLLLRILPFVWLAIPNLTDVAPPVRVFAKLVISLIAVMEPSVQRAQWVKPRDLVTSKRVLTAPMLHMPYQRRKLLAPVAMPNLMVVAVALRVLVKRVISLQAVTA